MGLLEDAIREHLDLKRSRGADPTEIERLEREALGPVRREPVSGSDRLETDGGEYGSHEPSPVEYHDSTAPHWQQEEDFGERHVDVVPVDSPAPEHGKRRGFLRRSRGGEAAPTEHEPIFEAEAPLGWPEHEEPAPDFADEHFGLAYAAPEDSHFDESYGDALDQHETGGHVTEEHFDEREPADGELDEHPQAGGRFEPDYGPPTEVYRPVDETVTDVEVASVPQEVERIMAPSPPAPQAGAHHPILDDLPPHEPASSANGDGDGGGLPGEPTGSTPLFEMEAASGSAPEPTSVQEASDSEVPSTPANDDPPQLQFARPPRRPSFSSEPPGLGGSENGEPKRPANSRSGRDSDELQGTLEFDVAGELEDAGVDEDVLEVTPDFLQDTPEHDRLWFEQRPPKDFDFDG